MPHRRPLRGLLQEPVQQGWRGVEQGDTGGWPEGTHGGGGCLGALPSQRSSAHSPPASGVQDDETTARLNAGIAAYLRLLSAHFVLPAAARTLEFLIRRYKCASSLLDYSPIICAWCRDSPLTALLLPRRVHVYNVEAAVLCALPFHTTAQFVRWLQVLQLEGTRWAFLSGVKTSGAAPTRDALTLAVSRNEALLSVLCDAALASATTSAKGISGVGASFYALLCSEAMGCMAQVPASVMPPVLAYVNAGFGSGTSAEHRAGALLLASQLAGRAQLSAAVVEALLEGIAKVAQPPLEAHALRAMLQVMRTHAVAALPRRAVTFLVKTPALSAVVGQLSRTMEANALVGPLLAGVVAQLGQHHTYVNALCALLTDVPAQPHAAAVTRQLLRAASPGGQEEVSADMRPRIVTALRTLQRCYPAEVNAVLDSELQAARGADAEGAVTAVISDAFGRTTAQPLASDAGVTLASGLAHTNPRLREAAVKQLGKLVATDASAGAHLGDVLVRRAADEDASVAAAALSLPGLIDLCANDTALHASLTATLASCSGALRAGRGSHAHEKAASKALAVLVQLSERTPAFRDAAARAIADALVDDAGVQALAKAARQASRKVTHAAFGEAGEAAGSADDVLAQQHAALRALGERLAGTDGAVAWATSDWSLLTPQGTHTVLLAFVAALTTAAQEARPRLALAAWQALLHLPPVTTTEETPAWASGLPPATHLASKDTAASVAAVQQQLWPLVALHIPTSPADPALNDLGNLGRVFARLCRQSSPRAMAVLIDRAATVFGSSDNFLALLAASDPAHVDSPVQLAAVAQLASPSADVLPLVMVALLHPRRNVREAACAALTAAGDTQPRRGQARRGKQGGGGELQLKAWVQSHQDTLCTGGASLQLLRGALREDALAAVTPLVLTCLASLQSPYAMTQLALMLNGTDAGVAAAFASVWPHVAGRSGTAEDVALARVLVDGIAAAAVTDGAARELLISALESSSLRPGLHAAVLDSVSEGLYAACTATEQRRILLAAISLSRRSSEPACSAAARSVVTRVSFDGGAVAELLVSLFTPDAAEQPTPAKRARRVATATSASQEGRAVAKLDGKAMDTVEAVLDVLQWRTVEHAEELLDPLFRVLAALLDAPREAAPEPAAQLDAAGEDPEDAVTPLSAARGYHLTLALTTTEAVVRGTSDCRIDVPLIVRAVQLAPDVNVRRAALQLLAVAAVAAPHQVIADALRVVQSLTSVASASLDDAQAARALHDAFVAIAPCCVQANSDNGELLMRQVVDALPAVPQHRRVPLLSALLQALPAPHALVATLRMVLSSEAEAHSLAAVLCSLRPQVECLRAWQAMLVGPDERPAQALITVADFIAGELKTPRFQSWFKEHVNENDAQPAYADLIAAVLTTLERVKEPKGGALERQSLDGVLAALKALSAEPMEYVLALAQSFVHADRRVQRRALLMASRCMHVGGAEAVTVTAQEAAQAAALHTHLLPLVRGDGQAHPASQRGALEVLVALNSRYGSHELFAEASLAILRAAVQSAAQKSRLSVRAAALSCVASSLAALSTKAVPVLPQVIPTVLDVLEATDVNAPDGVKASAAALAVLAELVLKLESFLSPVLARTQRLLLSASLCSPLTPPELRQAAGDVRAHIAARVPVRLLLEPLLGSWDAAISVGREACVAMLLQLKQLAERLDSAQTAAYSEAAFGALRVSRVCCCPRVVALTPSCTQQPLCCSAWTSAGPGRRHCRATATSMLSRRRP